jgi:hypothetical protein
MLSPPATVPALLKRPIAYAARRNSEALTSHYPAIILCEIVVVDRSHEISLSENAKREGSQDAPTNGPNTPIPSSVAASGGA